MWTRILATILFSAYAAIAASPNVVIILADDLGTADVGFRGSEIQTPNIDRLAREGTQFERFYSFPVCSPTRSALMTGRSPMRLGVAYSVIRPWLSYGLPAEEHLMPETFRAAGYQTAMAGKWHLGHSQARFLPHRRGFDEAYGQLNGAIDYYTHIRDGGLDWQRNGRSVREEGYSTDLLADEAVRRIGGRDKNRPLFLYLAFNAPHSPLQAPQALIDKYARISDQRRRTFAAMVDAMDSGVGRVLGALDDEGISGSTIVLFFSDNGGPTNLGARNTPLRGAKASTFEGGIRVPAVLRWPGQVRPGEKSQQVFTAMDIYPTLAAAAGVRSRATLPLDGRNLWPAVAAGKTEPREDLFFAVEVPETRYLAVHHGEWKLVRLVSRSDGKVQNLLFRIDRDPNETTDLSAENANLVRDLAGRIEKWQALHPREGTGMAHNEPSAGWKAPAQWAEAARE